RRSGCPTRSATPSPRSRRRSDGSSAEPHRLTRRGGSDHGFHQRQASQVVAARALRLLARSSRQGESRKPGGAGDPARLGQLELFRGFTEEHQAHALTAFGLAATAGPSDLAALALHAPFAGPVRLGAGAGPASAVAHDGAAVEGDGGERAGGLAKVAP